jgi:HlyD family secretion protein
MSAPSKRKGFIRRHPVWTVVGLLALAGAVQAAVSRARGPEVEAVQVRRGPLVQKVVVSGRVTPPSQVKMSVQLPGTVSQVAVEEGDTVQPGQLLLQLEPSEWKAQLQQAQAGVAQARARLRQVQRVGAPTQDESVRQAELQVEQAQRRVDRQRALVDGGSGTREQLEEEESGLRLAQSRLETARTQALGSVRGGPEVQLQQALVQQAEAAAQLQRVRLEQASVRATVPAVVLRRDVEPGDSVSPGRVLLVLARTGATRLSVEPDEKNLAFVREGQPALASADAFPAERFAARVESVAPGINPDRGTVEVKLAVPEPPAYLRPDMAVSVEVEVARRDAALWVPSEAVREAGSAAPWAWVVREGAARRVEVKTGLSGEGKVELLSGVSEGEWLLSGKTPVAEGARVRVKARAGAKP